MVYSKPEIVDSRRAFEAVQGVQKGHPLPPDSMKINTTASVYESEESDTEDNVNKLFTSTYS